MLSENLMLLREHRGLTKTAMAQHLNLTLEGYSAYERGRNIPPAETLVKLADFFNVSVDFLLDRKLSDASLDGEINFHNLLIKNIVSDLNLLSMQQQEKVVDYIRLLKIESEQHSILQQKDLPPHNLLHSPSPQPSDARGLAAQAGGVKEIDEEIEEDLQNLDSMIRNDKKE